MHPLLLPGPIDPIDITTRTSVTATSSAASSGTGSAASSHAGSTNSMWKLTELPDVDAPNKPPTGRSETFQNEIGQIQEFRSV